MILSNTFDINGKIFKNNITVSIFENKNITKFKNTIINSFLPNPPSLYPLKTSENLTVFWCFQEAEKVYAMLTLLSAFNLANTMLLPLNKKNMNFS